MKRHTFIRLHEQRQLRQEGFDWLGLVFWVALWVGLTLLTPVARMAVSYLW